MLAIREEVSGEGFTKLRGLFCFVRHDMPGFAEDEIIGSSAFKGCLAEGK